MPLYLSLQLPEQANTHKNEICVCLPDKKINLKHVHILENICITNDLSHPPATHPQLIRMYFLLHDPPDPRITRGPCGYNANARTSVMHVCMTLTLVRDK